MQKNDVEIIEDSFIHQSFLKLKRYQLRHKLYNGGWSEVLAREVLARPKVAAALPYDPVLDQVVLIEQFRPGAMAGKEAPWLLEVVAGVAEKDEEEHDLALREIREEAGLVVEELLPIFNYWVSPGMCNERVALFLAKVDASHAGGVHGLVHEHEDIMVYPMPREEAFAAVESGRIDNALAIIALQWLQLNLEKIRRRWA